jgi:hypothetical protein
MIEYFGSEVKNYSDRHYGKCVRIEIKIDSYITACINENNIYTKTLMADLTLEN